MLRLASLGSLAVFAAGLLPASAGGDPGARYLAAPLPPEIAYRDPAYIPAPPVHPALVAPVPVTQRRLNLPLYNEPPPRFPFF